MTPVSDRAGLAQPPPELLVQLGDGQSATAEKIVDHASGYVARYKLPKAVVFVDQIQRSPSGKADYRWAREQAEKG